MNLLSASRFNLESTFFRKITMNSLSASWFFFQFTICFLNSPWIHFLFCGTTMNSLWNHYETTRNSSSFSRIHYLFREFPMNSQFATRFLLGLTIFFANSLSVTLIYHRSTIFYSQRLWIRYEITIKSLVEQYEFTIFFAISLWIDYLSCEIILNPLSFLRNQ